MGTKKTDTYRFGRQIVRSIQRLLLIAVLFVAQTASASEFNREIDVMTLNQYLGADLTQVLEAAAAHPFNPFAFNIAVVAALEQVAANRTAERMDTQAGLIARRWTH